MAGRGGAAPAGARAGPGRAGPGEAGTGSGRAAAAGEEQRVPQGTMGTRPRAGQSPPGRLRAPRDGEVGDVTGGGGWG